MAKSPYKMKYQGNNSAFPFKSPLQHPPTHEPHPEGPPPPKSEKPYIPKDVPVPPGPQDL